MKKLLQFTSFFLCTMFLCFCIAPEAVKAADTVTVGIEAQYGQQEARDMLQMVNQFRTSASDAWIWNDDNQTKTSYSDLQPLEYDYELEKIAMLRAAEIALSYTHTRPNGQRCFTAYENFPYTAVGENIAAGYRTGNAVFEGWKEEDEPYEGQGHRRNMLGVEYNVIGIGHVYYNGTHYWVQELAKTSSLHVNVTPAVDGAQTVELEALSSNLSNPALICNQKNISMNAGESAPLPDVSLTVKVNGHWPSSASAPITSLGNEQPSALNWTSADESIASVMADGTLKAIAAGKTTVSASWNGMTASCEVTVRASSNNGSNENNNNSGNNSNNNSSNNNNNSNNNNSNNNNSNNNNSDNNNNANNGSDSDKNEKQEYAITFDANNGILNSSRQQNTYNQKLTTLPSASRTGYILKGWYTQPNGGYQVTTATIFTENATVYAQWEPTGPDFEYFSPETTDTTALLTVTIPNRYVKYWQISVGTTSSYLPETREISCYRTTNTLQVLLLDLTPDTIYYYRINYITDNGNIRSDVMAFTTKKATEYTIAFYGNGGTVSGQSSMITTGRSLTALPDAHREGYDFDGWYTEPYGGNQISTATIFDKDTTVYAHWKAIEAQKPTTTPTSPTNPSTPTKPSTPTNPVYPTEPSTPTNPVYPTEPSTPDTPVPGDGNGDDVNHGNANSSTVYVKKVNIKNVKNNRKGKIKVTWKQNKNNKGYQVAYSTNQNFASGYTKNTNAKATSNSKTISGLQKGKTYYVKVRAYKKKNGKKHFGDWSNALKVKIKK